MDVNILVAFLIGMTILSATPGVGVFSSVAQALSGGFKSSLFFIGGLVLGDVIFFTLALAGVSAISNIMGELFYIIRICGGLYLIYLGINTLRKNKFAVEEIIDKSKSGSRIFLSGLLVTLGNPKPILFYASIVPTIIDIGNINSIEIIILITLIALVSFVVIGSYCYLASLGRKRFYKNKFNLKLNSISGLTMITAGCYIVLKKS